MARTANPPGVRNPSASQGTCLPPDDIPQIQRKTNRRRSEREKAVGACPEEMLHPGWAGVLTDDELEFIIIKLRQRPGLAKKWGFRPTQGITPEAVRRVAMYGDSENVDRNRLVARPWFARRRD